MKEVFRVGDVKIHTYTVVKDDFATFHTGNVHPVCSTFALAREMEWSSRLFVLEMVEADEEGVGTQLEIVHHAPAFEGEVLELKATISSFSGNELICEIKVKAGQRLVASGKTGQKILNKEKLSQIFTRLSE